MKTGFREEGFTTIDAREFKPDPERKAILFVASYGPLFKQSLDKLDQIKELLVVECPSSLDAIAVARKAGACLILLHVASESDVQRHAALQKPLLPQIKRGEVRIVLTYMKGIESQAKWLANQLQADAVIEPVALKSLLFKIERYARALPKMIDASGAKPGAPSQRQRVSTKNGEIDSQVPVRFIKPLALESDIWASMKSGFKFQGGRWTVQLSGPPPLLGEWQRYNDQKVKIASQKESKLWVWVPKEIPKDLQIDPLIKEEGQWIFLGGQPKFQGNYWYFISAKPVLGFYSGAASLGNKLELDEEGALNVAGDSQNALTTLTLLESVLAERKAAEALAAKARSRGAASEKSKSNEAAESARSTFVMLEPLKLASDCFVLLKEKPRRVSRKWVISLMGPPPDTGKWVAAESKKSEGGRRADDAFWRWEPIDSERDLFVKEEGSWVFRGIQPRFIGNLWIFTAVQPELAFYCDGESKAAKLLTRPDGSLGVARDSQTALALLPVIEAGLEKVVKAKSIGQKSADSDGQLDSAKEIRMPKETFGEAGDWAFVARESGRKLYLYLPQELIEGKVEDPKKLPVYWTQAGSKKPELLLGNTGEEYLFLGQEPKKHERFADLPDSVRQLLGEKLGSAEGVRKFLEEAQAAEKQADDAEVLGADAPDDGSLHKVPKSKVSDKAGGWEVADSGSQGRRWFVFLPSDYDAEKPDAYREFKSFWTYFGQKIPRSVTEDGVDYWTFLNRAPIEVLAFGDLPQPVQNYFRASTQILAEAEEAEAKRKEEDELLFGGGLESEGEDLYATQSRKSKESSLDGKFSAEEARKSKELEIELDAEDATELDGRFKEEKSRELKGSRGGDEVGESKDAEFESEESSAELSFRDSKRNKAKSSEPEMATESDEEKANDDFEDSGISEGAKRNKKRKKQEHEEEEGQEERESGDAGDSDVEDEAEAEDEEKPSFDDFFEKESGQGVRKKAKKKDPKHKQVDPADAKLEEESASEDLSHPDGPAEDSKKAREKAAADPESGSESGSAAENAHSQSRSPVSAAASGPGAVKRGHPSKPTLSPLSIAFLVSELQGKRDELDSSRGLAPEKISHRFCNYVSKSMGEVRVELWVNSQGRWHCAGTYDNEAGIFTPLFGSMAANPNLGPVAYGNEPVFLVPVTELPGALAGSVAVGAVIFMGEGVDQIDAKWAFAVGNMARGVLIALSRFSAPALDQAAA